MLDPGGNHPSIFFSFLADFFQPLAYRRLRSPFWAGFSSGWGMISLLVFCSCGCQGPVPHSSPWHHTWQGLCHPHVPWQGFCHFQVLFHSSLEPQNVPAYVIWDHPFAHSYSGLSFSSWQPRVPIFSSESARRSCGRGWVGQISPGKIRDLVLLQVAFDCWSQSHGEYPGQF